MMTTVPIGDPRDVEFTHRLRGVDEREVRNHLAEVGARMDRLEGQRRMLQDTVNTVTNTRDALAEERNALNAQLNRARSEVQSLQIERDHLRREVDQLGAHVREMAEAEAEPDRGGAVDAQIVEMFRQAQDLVDTLIQEAQDHNREIMASARAEEQRIIGEARQRADGQLARPATELRAMVAYTSVARDQIRSIVETLGQQLAKLEDLPELDLATPGEVEPIRSEPESGWQLNPRRSQPSYSTEPEDAPRRNASQAAERDFTTPSITEFRSARRGANGFHSGNSLD